MSGTAHPPSGGDMTDRVPPPVPGFLRRSGARLAALGAALALVLAFTTPARADVQSAAGARGARPAAAPIIPFGCAKVVPGKVHCLGQGRLAPTTSGNPNSSGLKPADLESAYKLSGLHSGGRTVAIVDAFDDPNAASDLAVYRSAYGLPACTTANGCFAKVNQNGQASPLPSADYGWAEEESLDLDMVSAICPDCHIQLVEASGADTASLSTAEDTAAATPGVASVSNSWGGSEDSSTLAADSHFNHTNVAITASSGDSGYGVIWPASSRYVTAVGGTSLSAASNARGWTETAWSGAGSGCSSNELKPSWQADSGCANRTVADVSAVADPNTGVAVYDTANSCGTSALCDFLIALGFATGADGWVQVGGTSASSPIIASVYALAGNTTSVGYGSYPYSHTGSLFDVTSGSNGTCTPAYLCTAGPGYDGPTGLGTPNGTGGF
jgi:subtilase family serine protease